MSVVRGVAVGGAGVHVDDGLVMVGAGPGGELGVADGEVRLDEGTAVAGDVATPGDEGEGKHPVR